MCSTSLSKRKLVQLTQSECRAQIVKYVPKKKRIKERNMIVYKSSLVGIPSKKDGYVHVLNDCGQMSQALTPIPSTMKRGKVSQKIKKRFCDNIPDIKKEEGCAKKGLHLELWIQKSRSKQLTIQRVLNMKKGQKMKMLCLDRNLYDTTDSIPPNQLRCPAKFFDGGYMGVYTHDHDMSGTFKWQFQPKDEPPMPFTFEINYKNENWYPLDEDGTLAMGLGRMLGIKKSYKKFPKTTRVGWRGPMIPWNALKDLPRVYNCQFCSSVVW